MNQHTPEPWSVSDMRDMAHPDWKLPQINICSRSSVMVLATMTYDHMQKGENANRIVACVNACSGIETDVLKQNESKVSILLTQRDELLKFAQSIKDYAEKYPYDSGLYDHVKYELSTMETPL